MKLSDFILFALCTLVACDRIKNKVHDIRDTTYEKVKNESDELAENISPQFDADRPDTKSNQLRFKDFLQIELSQDIKNLYCFDDAIGIDADYMFAFNCDSSTAEKIKVKHLLKPDTKNDYGFGMQHDFDWWDKKKIEQLDLYSWNKGQYYKFFWYDQKEKKAYYFEFDL